MTSKEVKLMPLVTLWPLWVLRLNLAYDQGIELSLKITPTRNVGVGVKLVLNYE